MTFRYVLVAIAILACGILVGCQGGGAPATGTDPSKQIDTHIKPTGPGPHAGTASGAGAGGKAAPQ